MSFPSDDGLPCLMCRRMDHASWCPMRSEPRPAPKVYGTLSDLDVAYAPFEGQRMREDIIALAAESRPHADLSGWSDTPGRPRGAPAPSTGFLLEGWTGLPSDPLPSQDFVRLRRRGPA